MLAHRLLRQVVFGHQRSPALFACTSIRHQTAAAASSPSCPQRTRPSSWEIDGQELKPDSKWNVTPAVIAMLERHLHAHPGNPLNLIKQRIVNHFHQNYRKPGNRSPLFTVCDKEPRVVSNYDNFDSLLTPKDHVSRRPSDTYYVNEDHCLRAHTSAHQHNLMKQGFDNFLVVGDVYRRDEIDRTHYPCFHQMEGVRLYSADELFGKNAREKLELFANDAERTPQKQEGLSEDASKVLEIQLKETLKELCLTLFGREAEIRFIDAYFPFTHPSFEVEVKYEGKWLEVLGCGVMEQKILTSAGVTDKVGWAFGLGLERLAMVLYNIPDIRLFWSRDSGFLSQFADKAPEDNYKYVPISVHPQVYFDLSFWLPDSLESHEMSADVFDLIRSIGGNLVEQVSLTDQFKHKKTGKTSHCYRIVYRSVDKALTKEEVNVVHKEIEKNLVENYGVQIR